MLKILLLHDDTHKVLLLIMYRFMKEIVAYKYSLFTSNFANNPSRTIIFLFFWLVHIQYLLCNSNLDDFLKYS